MGTPLRVLFVENSEDVTSLLVRELRSGGYDPIFKRVDTAAAMQEMLRGQEWDCVISDISMPPYFSATAALELLKTSGIDLPFIVVLGRVGEHTAVATMRTGTHDLLIKQDLTRLIPVVERELREATVRREQKRIKKSLLESEDRYRMLVEMASDGIFIQRDGKFIFVNSAGLGILGATREEQVTDKPVYDFIHPEFREIVREHIRQLEEEGKKMPPLEAKILRLNESTIDVEVTAIPFVFQGNPVAQVIMRDITERKLMDRRLACEHAVTRVFAESPLLGQATSNILRAICKATGWEYGTTWNVDSQANVLRCIEMWHLPTIEVSEFEAVTRGFTFSRGSGLPGKVWASGKPNWEFAVNFAENDKFRLAQTAFAAGLQGAFAFPILYGEEVLGVMVFFSRTNLPPADAIIEMFAAIGNQIGQFIKQKRSEEALRAPEVKLNSILGSIDNVIWSISASTYETLYLNPAAEKLYGLPAAEFHKNKDLWLSMVHPEDRKRVGEMLSRLIEEGVLTTEYRIIRPDGEERWLEDRAHAVFSDSGEVVRFDGVASDITERKMREHQIEYLAIHDDLTGLPSRNLLTDRIAQEITHARRTERSFALLFIDLDHFKFVNDSYGHPVGDSLLKTVAREIRKLVREGDTVVRLGGDEFVILLSSLRNPEDTVWVTRKMLELFSRPLTVDNREMCITASIGASLYPSDGQDLDTLLMHADAAMYRAKELGRNGIQFYTLEMSAQTQERVALQGSLRQALELQQFELHYQPQVDIWSRRIIGMEALIRWNHPELGMLPPAKFIPLAEDTGLIVPIGEWVLRTACAQNKAWRAAGLPAVSVAVNLSARQFRHEDLVKSVTTTLAETGLEARHLELELPESLTMQNPEAVITTLKKLKALGVRLSIDDFGSGYSSLNYLKRFPVDRLKINQSFVHEISADYDDAAIAQALIALGHSMNFNVIVGGVETEAQLAFLCDRGCGDGAQGYLFSRPVPAADLITWRTAGRLNS